MDPLSPPSGVVARHPPAGCVVEWVLAGEGFGAIQLRLWRPSATAVARVEITTTPARFGPTITMADDLKRLGWGFLACLQALAPALRSGPAPPAEPDPQLSMFDPPAPADH